MNPPIYPKIRVATDSANPLALIAAVRLAMRRARVERGQIERFSREAMASDDPHRRREICHHWVRVEPG